MPKLPTQDDLGPLPSGRSGRPIARIDGTAVGEGMASFGKEMQKLGATLKQKQEENEAFDVERRALEFTRDQERDLNERRRMMEPGGSGFADNFRGNYDDGAREVIARAQQQGMSHRGLERLGIRLQRAGEQFHSRAYEHQLNEEFRYNREEVLGGLQELVADVSGNPDLLESHRRLGELRIRTPRLTPAQQESVARDFRRSIEQAAIQGEILLATTPEARERARQRLLGTVRIPRPERPDRSGQDFAQPQPRGRLAIGEQIYTYFRDRGLEPHQAAAVAANMAWESTGRTNAVAVNDNARNAPDAPHSFGIAQWNGDRLRALVDFARARNIAIPEGRLNDAAYVRSLGALIPLAVQLDFAWSEMQAAEGGALRAVQEAGDVRAATAAAIGYHRPRGWTAANPEGGHAFADRQRLADQILAAAQGQGPAAPAAPGSPPSIAALGAPPAQPAGMVQGPQGIDLDQLSAIRTPDLAPTRVRAFPFEADGRHYVLPGFGPDGRRLSEEQARQRFRQTGEHLGIFDNAANAAAYARTLWEGPAPAAPDIPVDSEGMPWPHGGATLPAVTAPGAAPARPQRAGGPVPPTAVATLPGEPAPAWTAEESGRATYAGPYAHVGFATRIAAARRLDTMDRQEAAVLDQTIKSWETQAGEGSLPSEAEIARVAEAVEAMGNADVTAHFQSVLRYAALTRRLATLPPIQMQAVIQAEQARQNAERASPVARRWLHVWEKLLAKTTREIETDPNNWAHRVGIVDMTPGFSFGNDASMQAHAARVRLVGEHLRQDPQFFSPAQRGAAADIARQGGRPMLDMLGSMVQHWGPRDAQMAIREIASADDAPELAFVGGMYLNAQRLGAAPGSPAMRAVEDAAHAIALRRDSNVRERMAGGMPKPEEERDAARMLGNAYFVDERARAAAIETTSLIYYYRHGRSGQPFDANKWRQIMREAVGETTEGNRTYGGIYAQRRGLFGGAAGAEILMPPNVRQDALPRIWEALRPEDLTDAFGNAPMTANGSPLSMRALRGMTLVSAGNGRYWIAQGDPATGQALWVTRSRGPADESNRYVLDLNALEPVLRQRVPEIYRGYVEPPRTAQDRLRQAYTPGVPERDILMDLPGAQALPPEMRAEFRRQFVAANPDPARRRAIEMDRERYGAALQGFIDRLPGEPGIDEPTRPGNAPGAPAGAGGATPEAGAAGRLERTRQAVGRMFGGLFGVAESAGVEQTGEERLAPRPTSWPSEDEIRQARQSGMGYGTTMERFMSGEEANLYAGLPLEQMAGRNLDDVAVFLADPAVRRYFTRAGLEGQREWTAEDLERTSRMYTAAQIAGNRAALVGLGLDPGRFVLNTRDRGINLGGAYVYGPMLGRGAGDRGYAGSSDDRRVNAPGETLAHEATHRSLAMLRRDSRTRGLVNAVMGREFDEEPTVRLVMWLLAGSPDTSSAILEGGGEPLRRHAEETYRRRDLAHYGLRRVTGEGAFPIAIADRDRLNDLTPVERAMALEIIAGELRAIRRPMGPR